MDGKGTGKLSEQSWGRIIRTHWQGGFARKERRILDHLLTEHTVNDEVRMAHKKGNEMALLYQGLYKVLPMLIWTALSPNNFDLL